MMRWFKEGKTMNSILDMLGWKSLGNMQMEINSRCAFMCVCVCNQKGAPGWESLNFSVS